VLGPRWTVEALWTPLWGPARYLGWLRSRWRSATSVWLLFDPGPALQRPPTSMDPCCQSAVADQAHTGQAGDGCCCRNFGGAAGKPIAFTSSPVAVRAPEPKKALAMISFSAESTPGPETAIPAMRGCPPRPAHGPGGPLCSDCRQVDPRSLGFGRILNRGFGSAADRLSPGPAPGDDCHAVAGKAHDPFDVGVTGRADWMPGIRAQQARQSPARQRSGPCLVIHPECRIEMEW